MPHDDEAIRALRRSIIAKQAAEADARLVASFEAMTLRELSDWVVANNRGMFDPGEFPPVDDLTDEEEAAAREEYESLADQILHGV